MSPHGLGALPQETTQCGPRRHCPPRTTSNRTKFCTEYTVITSFGDKRWSPCTLGSRKRQDGDLQDGAVVRQHEYASFDSSGWCFASEVRGAVCCCRGPHGMPDQEPLLFRRLLVICRTLLVQQKFSDKLSAAFPVRFAQPSRQSTNEPMGAGERRESTNCRNKKKKRTVDRVDVCVCRYFPSTWLS